MNNYIYKYSFTIMFTLLGLINIVVAFKPPFAMINLVIGLFMLTIGILDIVKIYKDNKIYNLNKSQD